MIKNDVNMIYFEIQWNPRDLIDGRPQFCPGMGFTGRIYLNNQNF